jgi:hypothetical protein
MYDNCRAVFFALGLVIHLQPELRADALELYYDVIAMVGRDPRAAAKRIAGAIKNAPKRLDGITKNTVFRAALDAGWKPPTTEEQEIEIWRGKATLSSIFDFAHSQSEAIERAARLINGTVDRLVRRRLGYSCAQSMLMRSYPVDIVLSALSAATGARVTRVPDFLLKARHG